MRAEAGARGERARGDGRQGWCPGALRPMLSGDGLIVRLSVSCGEVSPKLACEIAAWAQDFGNGAIDLSSRANLQLRGVSEAALPALQAKLAEAGLIDASPEAEAVRNVLVAPLAGLCGACDVRPYARAWERELSRDRELWRLPGKFGASFDAGAFPLGVETDLNFAAVAEDAFVVRLGGAPDVALGAFAGDQIVAVALSLARAFLAWRETPMRRMRDAVAAHGVAPFARAAGLATINVAAPSPRPRADWIGAHAFAGAAFVGVALPFGRIDAADLGALAKLAAAAGASALRLTPWRSILVPAPTLDAARGLAEAARRLGLILDPGDPLLAVAACPGAPACASALGPTREIARRLAPLLPRRRDGVALHVSGCAKGCAHPAPAPLTVVAAETGYDIVTHGRADAAPVARGLSPDALELQIGGLA